jgi:hypothetical protein
MRILSIESILHRFTIPLDRVVSTLKRYRQPAVFESQFVFRSKQATLHGIYIKESEDGARCWKSIRMALLHAHKDDQPAHVMILDDSPDAWPLATKVATTCSHVFWAKQ